MCVGDNSAGASCSPLISSWRLDLRQLNKRPDAFCFGDSARDVIRIGGVHRKAEVHHCLIFITVGTNRQLLSITEHTYTLGNIHTYILLHYKGRLQTQIVLSRQKHDPLVHCSRVNSSVHLQTFWVVATAGSSR